MKRLSFIIAILLALAPFVALQAAPHRGTGPLVASIMLNFAGNTATGGCTFASCLTTTRTQAETCYWTPATNPPITYAAPATPCITNLGIAAWQPGRQNLLLWSQDFTNAAWTKFNSTLTTGQTAPDNNATAQILLDNVTNGGHAVFQSVTKAATSLPYTFSCFAQQSTLTRMLMEVDNGAGTNGSNVLYNIAGQQGVTANSFGSGYAVTNTSIVNIGNGYARYTLSVTTDTATTVRAVVFLDNGTGLAPQSINYAGTGQGILLWGCELRPAAPIIGTYIPTTSTSVTMDGDQIKPAGVLATGLAAAQGYVIAQVGQTPVSSNYVLSRNTTTDAFLQLTDVSDVAVRIASAAAATASFGSLPVTSTGAVNLGSSWSAAGVSAVANGGAVATSASAYGGTFNSFIGSADGSTGYINGYIQTLSMGTTRPSDAVLLSLVPAISTPLCAAHYIDPVGGLDSNNGCATGTPWQTMAKVNAGSYVGSNSILFKGGTSITGCMALKYTTNIPLNSTSTSRRITIGSYSSGTGTILSNCPGANSGSFDVTSTAVYLNGFSLNLQDLTLGANGTATNQGTYIENGQPAPMDGVTVQRLVVNGFHSTNSASGGAGISLDGFANGDTFICPDINNVQFLNNSVFGLSGPTSPDDGGIGTNGCGDQHGNPNGGNIYNALQQGNLVYNQGGHLNTVPGSVGTPLILNSVGTGTQTGNIAHDFGANQSSCGGPMAIWQFRADAINTTLNEAYNGSNAGSGGPCDTGCYDFDGGSTNSFIQYNYCHGNIGPCFINFVQSQPWHDNTARFNVCENNNTQPNDGNGAVSMDANGPNQYLYNNTIFMNFHLTGTSPASCWTTGFGANLNSTTIYANNLCINSVTDQFNRVRHVISFGPSPGSAIIVTNGYFKPGSGQDVSTLFQFTNSTNYTSLAAWQAGTGFDTGSNASDPTVSGTLPFGGCTWTPGSNPGPQFAGCPAAYTLNGGSPDRSSGTNLAGAPYSLTGITRDYYGNAVAPGTCNNIGAFGTCP